VDLAKLSPEDRVLGGSGLVLMIDLLFFPWHHESVSLGSVSVSASQSATSAPDAAWGVLALLVVIAVVVDLALARFSPNTQLPTTPLGRGMTRAAAAGLALFLLLIKLIAQTHYLGLGAWLGLVLAGIMLAAAYRTARAD